MNGVIGASLLGIGMIVVLYSIMPSTAWVGLLISSLGVAWMYQWQKDKLEKVGLRVYIPDWLNNFLTRPDVVDQIVLRIRENGIFHKVMRLLMIKTLDLSRDEIIEVLSGIWPRFRDLTDYNGSILQYTPNWFRNSYGRSEKLNFPQDDRLPIEDSFVIMDAASPSQRVMNEALSSPSQYDLYPLLMWIAERRVRTGIDTARSVMKRSLKRIILPLLMLFVVYKRYPKSRRPLRSTLMVILLVYFVSITRGLRGGMVEEIFKFFGIPYRRLNPRGRQESNPHNGSLTSVLYALIEPLVPIVGEVRPPTACDVKFLPPNSPAPSQASTAPEH
jgi:hypothetical protein